MVFSMTGLAFLKVALKKYTVVGALAPTSQYVHRKIVRELKPEYQYIVEYGAGDGAVTNAILKELPRAGRLVAIETEEGFIPTLERIEDERLTVVHNDVRKVVLNLAAFGLPRIDMAISGIPFSFIKSADRETIIQHTYAALASGGRFVVYQHFPFMYLPLKKKFKKVSIGFEPRNESPCFIMVAEK